MLLTWIRNAILFGFISVCLQGQIIKSQLGECTLAPDFDGVVAANSAAASRCAIEVVWQPGVSRCGSQSLVYKVYRNDVPVFTPTAMNQIADCISGTSFIDYSVTSGETYYYTVRAEDPEANGEGSCGGVVDENTVVASALAQGTFAVVLEDDLEQGTGNFSTVALPGDQTGNVFALTTTIANSPVNSYFCRNEVQVKDQALVLNALEIGRQGELSFYHRFNTDNTWDGGVLEYSLDGTNFVDILASQGQVPASGSRFSEGGYTGVLNGSSTNPLAGRSAWTGDSLDFVLTRVDLSDFAEQTVTFRWRFGNDDEIAVEGWYLDDFAISDIGPCTPACSNLVDAAAQWPSVNITEVVICVNALANQF